MEQINHIIAGNIKQIRKERKMSLDNLADATGVSKSMLGQIERDESSPTIATLWKIAVGLGISFTYLIENRCKGVQIIKNKDLQPLVNEDNTMRIYPVFPYNDQQGFEILFIELDEGAVSPSLPHQPGTEEFISVFEGALALELNDDEYLVEKDTSIRYFADCPHCYKNGYNGMTRLSMTIRYQK